MATDTHLYVPTYGQANDRVVLDILAEHSSKQLVPIDATGVCHMGGSCSVSHLVGHRGRGFGNSCCRGE